MTKEKTISYLESLLVRCDFEDMYGEPIDSEPYEEAVEEAIDIIRDAPTIDVVKHGRWIGGELGYCSCCGHHGCASDIWTGCDDGMFCPNCGADMREREES